MMKVIERIFGCDPAKRLRLLDERGFDLLTLAAVFQDEKRLDYHDNRFDYGEERRVTIGKVSENVFTVVYTQRDTLTWLITAWFSNRKERERYE